MTVNTAAARTGDARSLRAMIAARLGERQKPRDVSAEERAYGQYEKQRLTDVRRALSIEITA